MPPGERLSSADDLVGVVGRFVREVGFPAAVAAFVLWRLDGRVEQVARSGEETVAVLRELRGRVCVCGPAASSSTAPSAAPGALHGPALPAEVPAGAESSSRWFRVIAPRQPVTF